MYKFLLILLIAFSFASMKVTFTVEGEMFKVVNDIGAFQGLAKASVQLVDLFPMFVYKDQLFFLPVGAYLGVGFSEGYTAPRSNQYAYNHAGTQFNVSFGMVILGVEVIYTHSAREWFTGANPKDFFFYNDVDSIKFRITKEIEVF